LVPRNIWGFLLVVPLLLLACDGGEEEARPEPTSSSVAPTTVTTASEASTCRPEESPEPTSEDGSIVLVYFICEERHSGLSRRVPPGEGAPLRTALEELVKGPNERERKAGFRSPFDGFESDRLLVGVVLKDGHAVIDFSRALADQNIGGGTAFAGSLFGSLDPTVFQFPSVKRVTYRLDGDARALCLEFQMVCEPLTREEWEKE
jgi:spore germination protein GerM